MIPHGDDVIQKDDRVVLVGKPEAIEDTRKLFEETRKNSGKISVVGEVKSDITLLNSLRRKNFKLTLLEIDKKRRRRTCPGSSEGSCN